MKSKYAVALTYDRLADIYDDRWAKYIIKSTEQTLRYFPVSPARRILDVGCGTGAMIRRILGKWPESECYGIDISERMLKIARERLGNASRLFMADVTTLPFADQSFDLVVSTSSFHYWSDPGRALAEIHRVLCPKGILVITDWCSDYLVCRICDIALRLIDDAHQHCYGRRYCAQLLNSSGFKIDQIAKYKIDWLWGLMTAVAEKPIDQNMV